MPALAQLLARHGCLLVLDAASTSVQVGLLRTETPPDWRHSTDESGKALFVLADECLRAAGIEMNDVAAFVFCEGPGSMLGIRTVAMAIRTWQTMKPRPAYRYQSLELLACALQQANPSATFSVIADARRESWHCVGVSPNETRAMQRIATAELAASSEILFQPGAFRSWALPPRATTDCAYDVARLAAAHPDRDLFRPTDAPDAFQYEAPVYKKWSAQVHSAATLANK